MLTGIDLTVRPGEVVALVGPSGAGKSTIAALLTRLYDPDGGRVMVDGHDLRGLSPDGLRRRIGVVSQEPILFSCSIAENIRYGRAAPPPRRSRPRRARPTPTTSSAGSPTGTPPWWASAACSSPAGRSSGWPSPAPCSRIRASSSWTRATSALDAESEHLVKEALDRLMKGRTTLIIAHRLSTVKDADRVCVIDGGRIVESGAHAALMGQDGLYKRLVERQFVAA